MVKVPKEKKVAVLTWATWGIGKDFAQYLAQKGYTMCLLWRNKEILFQVLNTLNETHPGDHSMHPCDLTNDGDIDRAVSEIMNTHWVPDLVINNAGVLDDPHPLHKYTPQEIKNTIAINLTGTILFTQKIISELLEAWSRCKIVIIGSTAWLYPYPYRSIYAAGKSWLKNFVESVGAEYKDWIEINFVGPGPTEWHGIDTVVKLRTIEKIIEEYKAKGVSFKVVDVDWTLIPEENLCDAIRKMWDQMPQILDDNGCVLKSEQDMSEAMHKMKKKFSSIVSDNWKFLTNDDLFRTIDCIINGDLERVIWDIFTWHSIWFDEKGIYIKSNIKAIEKNSKIMAIPEKHLVKYDARRYLIEFPCEHANEAQETKNLTKVSKIFNIGSFKNVLSHTYRYAAILIVMFLAGSAVKINQKAENLFADFKEWKYNIKDYDHEMRRIALEEYGIEHIEDLLRNANETQNWDISNLYFEIWKKAYANMKAYSENGGNVTWIDLGASIDI